MQSALCAINCKESQKLWPQGLDAGLVDNILPLMQVHPLYLPSGNMLLPDSVCFLLTMALLGD